MKLFGQGGQSQTSSHYIGCDGEPKLEQVCLDVNARDGVDGRSHSDQYVGRDADVGC